MRLHLIDLTFGDELGEQLLERARGSLIVALLAQLPDEASPWFDNIHTGPIEARDDVLRLAFEAAIVELEESLGPEMSQWRWGELHTATFENQSLGQSGIGIIESVVNRGPVAVDGTIATVNNTGYRPSAPYDVAVVPSYRQIVDMADFANSVSMHTTGQSGHPFHQHYDDMIDPWRNIEYHPMLWERAAVEAAAKDTLVLRPE
jgi:penicillin amidase